MKCPNCKNKKIEKVPLLGKIKCRECEAEIKFKRSFIISVLSEAIISLLIGIWIFYVLKFKNGEEEFSKLSAIAVVAFISLAPFISAIGYFGKNGYLTMANDKKANPNKK